jgi:hypothetical protein
MNHEFVDFGNGSIGWRYDPIGELNQGLIEETPSQMVEALGPLAGAEFKTSKIRPPREKHASSSALRLA